uniref:Ig-like domain-containing protein n=1 Tax=Cyprinodon variegatus TaxID=28743 RepID=A0A3Q2CF83_CYPVA
SSSMTETSTRCSSVRPRTTLEVRSGEVAEFSCSFDGQPFTSVVWDHNGQNLVDTERVRRSEGGGLLSLLIQSVDTDDQGTYRCTATNPFGQSTCSSFLRVQVKEPEEERRVGEEIYTLSGDPLPDVQWFKGSSIIQPAGFVVMANSPDGSGFFSIESVKEENSGTYTCKACNLFGEAACSAELVVIGQKAQQERQLIQKTKGLKISLTEQSTESRLNHQAVSSVPEHYRTSCEKNKHTLEIAMLEAADGGLYVCRASNDAGVAECSTELLVVDKPSFVKPLGPVAAVVGAPLHLECQVDEDTGVTVTWTRDGRKVHQSPDCKLSFENKTVNLDILKTTLKDCGNYVCTVANEAGSSSCSTSVKVQGKV